LSQQQYQRQLSLVVADDSGDGLDLSSLRTTFTIRRAALEAPNNAEFVIYNVAEQTAQRINDDFERLEFKAGYPDNFGTVLKGDIQEVQIGKDENNVDTFIKIYAGDGDTAYNRAIVNKSLAPGATRRDAVNASLEAMEPYGVTAGSIQVDNTITYPGGKVLQGMARDVIRKVADTEESDWSIQDGGLQIVPKSSFLPDPVIVLNSKTGLIGRPEQTENGINARCLLNPFIKPGTRVQIDQASINQITAAGFGRRESVLAPTPITSDGFYKVLMVDFVGDSRGRDFYADLVLTSIDAVS